MTYSGVEASQQSGSPVELYKFAIGNDLYNFSSGEEEVVLASETYEPLEISRSTIVVSGEQDGDLMSITVPASTPLVRRYINVVPGQVGTLSIFRLHRTDMDEEFILHFKGLVRSVAFTLNGLSAEIVVKPLSGGLSRNVPRFVFSASCNNVLYDARFKVNSSAFRHEGAIAGIDGAEYTITGLSDVSRPDGWATAGFMVSPNGTDFRLILDHTGDVVTLLLPFPTDVVSGQVAEVFAGCAHDIETCEDKFDNVPNYGGFNWVPRENVFVKGIKGE